MSDIAILFAKDPLKLTNDDLDKAIAAMREARHKFGAGDKTAGAAPKLTEKEKVAQKLDLGDLNI